MAGPSSVDAVHDIEKISMRSHNSNKTKASYTSTKSRKSLASIITSSKPSTNATNKLDYVQRSPFSASRMSIITFLNNITGPAAGKERRLVTIHNSILFLATIYFVFRNIRSQSIISASSSTSRPPDHPKKAKKDKNVNLCNSSIAQQQLEINPNFFQVAVSIENGTLVNGFDDPASQLIDQQGFHKFLNHSLKRFFITSKNTLVRKYISKNYLT